MKQALYLTISLIFTVTLASATVRTVSNTPSTLAQFNTIQAAIDASNNGDTVYVHGSPNQYAGFTITNKKVIVIGPGWSPNKNLPFTALVSGFTLTGVGCAETEIQGLVVNSTAIINNNQPSNIRIIRNHFTRGQTTFLNGGGLYSGYLFEGNYFENSQVIATSGSTYQNFLFQNNLFLETACCLSAQIHGFTNSINVLFDHNLFYGPTNGVRTPFTSNCRFLTLTNNIFVRRDPGVQNSQSVFNNNLTFFPAGSTAPSDPWTINGNINSGGNVSNQDPQMADQTAVNSGTEDPLLNFAIAAGPANNSGSDGKDMGLLFDATGSLNWAVSRNSRLPFIFSMNIINPTIPQGGSLNINVEARKSN